jgi:hypothetical protein
MKTRKRPLWQRIVFWCGGILLSWYPLSLIHESGHLLSAWFGGAQEISLVWHYGVISETLREQSRWPIVDVWAGPIFGVLIPLFVVWGNPYHKIRPILLRFAALCALGNGLYIGLGWLEPGGDAWTLLGLGCPLWALTSFGFLALTLGIWLLVCSENMNIQAPGSPNEWQGLTRKARIDSETKS